MKCIRKDQAYLWKPEMLDGISLFKAQFHQFVYSKHTHNEFAIGVIEYGAQKFFHKGQMHIAPSRAIITVNPVKITVGVTETFFANASDRLLRGFAKELKKSPMVPANAAIIRAKTKLRAKNKIRPTPKALPNPIFNYLVFVLK